MRVCAVCGMATRSGICLTCGTEEEEKIIAGVTDKQPINEFEKTTLPFDLQESNRRKLKTPVFGLEASPEYQGNKKTPEKIEKSGFTHNLPFGFKDAPDATPSDQLIFGLSDAPGAEE